MHSQRVGRVTPCAPTDRGHDGAHGVTRPTRLLVLVLVPYDFYEHSLAAAAMLREPLGLREIAALVFTLGGVAVALRA